MIKSKCEKIIQTHRHFGNDDDKIHAKAFLSCSQSSTVEETNRRTVTVGIVCERAVYEGREMGRRC